MLDSARHLEMEGIEVTYLPVQPNGLVDLKVLEAAITPKTALVSIMAVNNEIGVIQPMAEIGALCRSKGVYFHTDAAQAAGKIPLDVEAMKIDLMSISGHKIYGPKGIGALYVRRKPRVRLEALIHGGGQERGMRSGTLPTPLCVGLGEACEIARKEMPEETKRLTMLRDRLYNGITSRLSGCGAERRRRAAHSRQPQSQLRLCRRRGADDGDQGTVGLVGLGLYLGFAGALLCPARSGRGRGDGPYLDPLRDRPLHHRSRRSISPSSRWWRR